MEIAKRMSSVRWTVCALVFFATTVNYFDRQIISLLVPFFEDDLKLGPTDLALINVSFILPYGFAMLFVGRLIDRVGIRKGLSGAFLLWNVASMAHALVHSLTGFLGVRFLLGLGESGMFPAAVKTMTEWFPRKERALATGIFNAGANCGAILAPLFAVGVAEKYGWRTCFFITGGVGLIWIFFWYPLYKPPAENPKVNAAELAYIRSDAEENTEPLSYRQIFGLRPLWGLGIAKALTDAPWWFYLTWMPKFLIDQFHLTPDFMKWAVPVIYIIADGGSVFGGWLSSTLIKAGKSVGASRKLAMLTCAIAVVPVMAVGLLVDHGPILGLASVYWAVAIVSLAAGAHQGWSCNLFTLVSDTVPKSSIAVAVGAINGFAMIGVAAMQFFVGRVVQLTSSYTWPFVVAGSLYLIALAVIQFFLPQVELTPPTRLAKIPYVITGAAAFLVALLFMQYVLNRPPYASLIDYEKVRQTELHALAPPAEGPMAQVGWMRSHWFRWQLPSGPKFELVKFDTAGRPIVEAKGAAAAKYKGPPMALVQSLFSAAG